MKNRKLHRRLVSTMAAMLLGLQAPGSVTAWMPVAAASEDTVYTFNNTEASRIDVSDQLPDASNDTMVWKGEFKTSDTSSVILCLASVCGTSVNNYLGLYVKPASGTMGFEFREQGSSNTGTKHDYSANVSVFDNEWHSYELKASPTGYVLKLDGEVIIDEKVTALTAMNAFPSETKKMYIGGMLRGNNGSNWKMNGSMRNVTFAAYDSTALLADSSEYLGDSFAGETVTRKRLGDPEEWIQQAQQGTFAIEYKLDNGSQTGLQTLLCISPDNDPTNYLTFFVNASTNTLGVEGKNSIGAKSIVFDGMLGNTDWHTALFSFDGTQLTISLDGVSKSVDCSGALIGDAWTAQSMYVGAMNRADTDDKYQWAMNGSVARVVLLPGSANDDQIEEISAATMGKTSLVGTRTTPISIYAPDDYDSGFYRIPGMVMTEKGTVIISSDARVDTQADEKNIDSVIRRRVNGEWLDSQVVMDSPGYVDENGNEAKCTFIDPALLSAVLPDGTNRIFMINDMFTENKRCLLDSSDEKQGSGFKEIDGNLYQICYSKDTDDSSEYTIRENGHIFNAAGVDTGYVANMTGTQALNYGDAGTLTAPDGSDAGNVFLRSTEKAGQFQVFQTQYLWMSYSDDDGATWSAPENITGQVKESWMKFLGTGPGRGIQLKNGEHKGRLVFPVYSGGANVLATQASAVIYSDDYGQTWTLGESPVKAWDNTDRSSANFSGKILTESQVVELNDGSLRLFMRNNRGYVMVSKSDDGGATWSTPENTPVYDCYCMVSALHVNYQDNEYVILSNPTAYGRYNAGTTVGKVNTDGSISWNKSKVYMYGHTQYSCLEDLGDGRIGVVVEGDDERVGTRDCINQYYIEFDMDYLLSDSSNVTTSIKVTSITSSIVHAQPSTGVLPGDSIRWSYLLDQAVFVEGDAQIEVTMPNGTTRAARCVSGNGTNQPVFEYVVQEGDPRGNLQVSYVITDEEGNPGVNWYGLPMYSRLSAQSGSIGPNADADYYDLDIAAYSKNVADTTWGDFEDAFDHDSTTFWHSPLFSSSAAEADRPTVTMDLGKVCLVDGVRYLARSGSGDGDSNGRLKQYKIYVGKSLDDMVLAADGNLNGATGWSHILFDETEARYVQLVWMTGESNSSAGMYASAAELRVTGREKSGEVEQPVDKSALETAIDDAKEANDDLDSYQDGAEKDAFVKAYADAQAVFADENAVQADVDAAVQALNQAKANLKVKEPEPEIDYSLLILAGTQVLNLDQSLYSTDLTELRTLTAQKAALINTSSDQQEVDDAARAVNEKYVTIRLKPQQSALAALEGK